MREIVIKAGLCLGVLTSIPSLAHSDKTSLFEMGLDELLRVKIISASRFEEPIIEAIVPATVITQEMIQESGARTLKDLLVTFVPGVTFVQDQNEVNVAMRGIYTSTQSKMLILLEGHRLNSRVIGAASPDHSIGLDKIKQIEVIRGPGSAAYGNVALTGVINIILKSGRALDGGEVAVAAGNYGQKKISANYGKPIGNNGEWLSWLYYFESDGESNSILPENDYARVPGSVPVNSKIGGFTDNPSHDIGFKAKWDNWSTMLNHRRSHYIEPFTSAQLTGEAYHYNDYLKYKGIGPGFQYTFAHAELTYNAQVSDKLEWFNQVYYDESDMESLFVINPAIQLFGFGAQYDESWGLVSQLSYDADWGQFLIGYQYDEMSTDDSQFPIGIGQAFTGALFDEDNPLLRPGKENVNSIFTSIKTYFSDQWVGNFGLRFDNKDRLTGSNQEELSPRLGLAYNSGEVFNLKVSFTESFVDPPYWNRYGALPAFRGSEDLNPERLKSFQITPSWSWLQGKVNYELNFYFNEHEDFIFRNNNAGPNEPINSNAGRLDTWGHEHQLVYQQQDWQLRVVGAYYKVTDSADFNALGDEIFNVPQITLNIIWDKHWTDNFSSHASLRHIGERLSPIHIVQDGILVADPFPGSGVEYDNQDNRLGSENILDVSFTWKNLFSENSNLELHLYNLTDESYFEGGTTLHPYRQEGLWYQLQWRYSYQ